MNRKHAKTPAARRNRVGAGLLAVLVLLTGLVGATFAQQVTIETLTPARTVNSIVVAGDRVLAATDLGGILVLDRNDPAFKDRWVSGQQLSGNFVHQLAWTGRYVWAATGDNGLTRIDDAGGDPTFRQYLANIASVNTNCVTGAVIDGTEIVYYGMQDAGIGKITDGIPGFVYNAEQDGLISDSVNDMQLLEGDLFVATDIGISRLRENLFSDQNAGLPNLVVYDLALDSDGGLLAATHGGVFRWNTETEAWEGVGQAVGRSIAVDVADDGTLYSLSRGATDLASLFRLEGETWTEIGVPRGNCTALFAEQDVWLGGEIEETGMSGSSGYAYVAKLLATDVFDTREADVSLVRNAEGLCFGADGAAWVGSWLADAISTQDADGQWRHLYEVDDVNEDGMFNHFSNVLCMAADANGSIWAGQFDAGVLRIDPQTLKTEQVTPANSGLDGRLLLNILRHPDGQLLFQHDVDGGMVDILLDPDDWQNPTRWVSLPKVDVDGIGGTDTKVWDAVCERRDVIWFAVEGRGLVRWDVNGYGAGPDDELTWTDFSDDYWATPVTTFHDTAGRDVSDARAVRGLEMAADGTIWAAGTGLVRFGYEFFGDSIWATAYENWSEKTASYQTGLLNGSATDVAVDVNGDAWVATAAGVNRIRSREDGYHIDPFIDLGNYLLYPSYTDLYSPTIVAELPGIAYRRLQADATGERLLVSSDLGAAMLHVDEGFEEPATPGSGTLESVACYPNPWTPDSEYGALRLGGFGGGEDDPPAVVEIYNLEGQIVYRSSSVEPDTDFWYGKNRPGEEVATGLYLLRITWSGHTATRTLAVVR